MGQYREAWMQAVYSWFIFLRWQCYHSLLQVTGKTSQAYPLPCRSDLLSSNTWVKSARRESASAIDEFFTYGTVPPTSRALCTKTASYSKIAMDPCMHLDPFESPNPYTHQSTCSVDINVNVNLKLFPTSSASTMSDSILPPIESSIQCSKHSHDRFSKDDFRSMSNDLCELGNMACSSKPMTDPSMCHAELLNCPTMMSNLAMVHSKDYLNKESIVASPGSASSDSSSCTEVLECPAVASQDYRVCNNRNSSSNAFPRMPSQHQPNKISDNVFIDSLNETIMAIESAVSEGLETSAATSYCNTSTFSNPSMVHMNIYDSQALPLVKVEPEEAILNCPDDVIMSSPDDVIMKEEPMGDKPSCQFQQMMHKTNGCMSMTSSVHMSTMQIKSELPSYSQAIIHPSHKPSELDAQNMRPSHLPLNHHCHALPSLAPGVQVLTTPSVPINIPSGSISKRGRPSSFPPTPPNSQPGSPDDGLMSSHCRLPTPPPYPGHSTGQSKLNVSGDGFDVPLTPVTGRPRKTHPGCTTIKYNRKNNPDLERRRIHFCDFACEYAYIIQVYCGHYKTLRTIMWCQNYWASIHFITFLKASDSIYMEAN